MFEIPAWLLSWFYSLTHNYILAIALIAVVAIVIDRRSFLIAGVGYCVALAGTVFGGGGSDHIAQFFKIGQEIGIVWLKSASHLFALTQRTVLAVAAMT